MPKVRARNEQELPDLWRIAFEDERKVVGGCLLDPVAMSKCGFLASTHFTNPECRAVWLVMSGFQKQGDSWDLSSVESELARQGVAEPEAILCRLTEGTVVTDVGTERAAARVREMSLRCRIAKEVEKFQGTLLDPSSNLNQTLQSIRHAIGGFSTEYEENHLGLPWATSGPMASVAGSVILDEIGAFVQRFVVLDKSEIRIISLWIAHTWAFEACDATPYLAVTSAEMRSGKTRLLEILELLVHQPWRTGRVSAAALARKIENDRPTLLLDEWDATARGNQELTETLRGILNTGHRRDGKVSVCGLKNASYQPIDFRVFCPKVISGIGKLPETIADRSIQIRLKRKAPGEKVERFRRKLVSDEANTLKARLRGWVGAHLEGLKNASPELPESLSDRQQDGAEPLLVIADAAGGDWPTRARLALTEIYSSNKTTDESVGVMLLSDIRDIFFERDAEELSSKEVAEALGKIEGRPWPTWDPRPMTPNALARLLAPFDVSPRNLRIGLSVVRGYRRDDFADSWNRYLSSSPAHTLGLASATPLQAAIERAGVQLSKKQPEPDVAAEDTISDRPWAAL